MAGKCIYLKFDNATVLSREHCLMVSPLTCVVLKVFISKVLFLVTYFITLKTEEHVTWFFMFLSGLKISGSWAWEFHSL
jgi:hypothetical protein